MANRVVLSRANATQGAVRHIEGDTFAGLPVTGVSEGVTAWAIDTATLYFWNGATWEEFGTGGGPGGTTNNYFPAGWS